MFEGRNAGTAAVSEMSLREGPTRARFQIVLEPKSLGAIAEGDIGGQSPRLVFGRVLGFARVVLVDAAIEIGRGANIEMALAGLTFEDVDER